MNNAIDLKQEYLVTVKEILCLYLPPNATTWLFGSRASGKAKKYSDFDLLVDIGCPIPIEIMTKLKLAFEESNLPYKVDIVDMTAINDVFRKISNRS